MRWPGHIGNIELAARGKELSALLCTGAKACSTIVAPIVGASSGCTGIAHGFIRSQRASGNRLGFAGMPCFSCTRKTDRRAAWRNYVAILIGVEVGGGLPLANWRIRV